MLHDKFFDRTGLRVPRHEALDANGAVRSGISMRTSMLAMDSLQRAVADDAALREMWRDGRVAVEEARQEMIQETSNAWRNPGGLHTGDAAPSASPRPISMIDARRIRDEAYRQMCDDLENAWRGTR